jgi:hypothetical protein
MKFYASLLTLSAILSSASAFAPQVSKTGTTALKSSYLEGMGGRQVGTAGPGPQVSSPLQRDGGSTFYPPKEGGAPNKGVEGIASPDMRLTRGIWDKLTPVTVQGGSLRTWSGTSSSVERVQVFLKTDGRPLNADVDLWQGPDNTPQKMKIYIEDGAMRPLSAVIATPRGPNAIAIRNTGHLEFPLAACVLADAENTVGDVIDDISDMKTIQGGAIHTYPFAPAVASVSVLLRTDGRPLNARIELLQGPNNNKQVIEVYTEDGRERPFFAVIETPGTGNVVRIVNTATVEFPMTAAVEPYLVEKIEAGSMQDGGDGFFIVDRQW